MADGINNAVTIIGMAGHHAKRHGIPIDEVPWAGNEDERNAFEIADIATNNGLDLLGPETQADLLAKEKEETTPPTDSEQPDPFYMFD